MDRSANLDTEELKVGDKPGAVIVIWVGSRPALSAARPRGRGLRGAFRGAPAARGGAMRGSRSPGRGARSRAQAACGEGMRWRAATRAERGRERRHKSINNNNAGDDDGHDGGDDGYGAARVL